MLKVVVSAALCILALIAGADQASAQVGVAAAAKPSAKTIPAIFQFMEASLLYGRGVAPAAHLNLLCNVGSMRAARTLQRIGLSRCETSTCNLFKSRNLPRRLVRPL